MPNKVQIRLLAASRFDNRLVPVQARAAPPVPFKMSGIALRVLVVVGYQCFWGVYMS